MNEKIRIFTTPSCVYCNTLKKFLGENNIVFEEVDVSKDQKALEEMVQKSGQRGVPVLEIGRNIVVGFDKGKIKQLLNI